MPRLVLTDDQRRERKFWTGLRSALRRLWMWYSPERREALAAARINKAEWRCAECGKGFKQKDVAVDHVVPCGSLKGLEDLEGFVRRLLVKAAGLQVLCKELCHQKKTDSERQARRKT